MKRLEEVVKSLPQEQQESILRRARELIEAEQSQVERRIAEAFRAVIEYAQDKG